MLSFYAKNTGDYSPEGYITVVTNSKYLKVVSVKSSVGSKTKVYPPNKDPVWFKDGRKKYYGGYLVDSWSSLKNGATVGMDIKFKAEKAGTYYIYWRAAFDTKSSGYQFIRKPTFGFKDPLGYYAYSATIKISSKNLPDLLVSSIYASQSGQIMNIELTVENRGSGNSGQFTVNIYLSKLRKGIDWYVCSHTFTKLLAGKSETEVIRCTVPSELTSGRYYVTIYVDANNRVIEQYENNNLGSKEITLSNLDSHSKTSYSELVMIIDNETKIYMGYRLYWYNSSWWMELSNQKSQEYARDVFEEVYSGPTDLIKQLVAEKLGVSSVLGTYSLAMNVVKIAEGIKNFFDIISYSYISMGVDPYFSNTNEKVRDYLKQLERNGRDIKLHVTKGDSKQVVNLLLQRKALIEQLYELLPAYDIESYNTLKSSTFITNLNQWVYYQNYQAYKTIKYFTMTLYLELQMDYAVTTYWINELSSGQPQKLNVVAKNKIVPTRFDPSRFKAEYLGCLEDIFTEEYFVIRLSSEDLKSIKNPKLVISVSFSGKLGNVYVKYGSKASDVNYDYKGRYIEIVDPKLGDYHILLKGDHSIYRLNSYLKFNEKWYGLLYDMRGVNLRYENT
ncbi:hypothetical protein DRP05_05380 [Archaeoglobales archaeon]|nr:MAG: hypothetical protein DRP05_05380 [Archaeoglobales archaeon]